MAKQGLKILQAILGRRRAATNEVLMLAQDKRAPILLIQEPYNYLNRVSGLGKYSNQILVGNNTKACIVILNKIFTATLIGDISTSHCVCAHIEGPTGDFYVISAYLQYSLPAGLILQQIHAALKKIGNRKVIIGMDANGVSPSWSFHADVETDERGAMVEDFLAQWNLLPLNRPYNLCTFRTGSRDIDLTVSDIAMALKVKN